MDCRLVPWSMLTNFANTTWIKMSWSNRLWICIYKTIKSTMCSRIIHHSAVWKNLRKLLHRYSRKTVSQPFFISLRTARNVIEITIIVCAKTIHQYLTALLYIVNNIVGIKKKMNENCRHYWLISMIACYIDDIWHCKHNSPNNDKVQLIYHSQVNWVIQYSAIIYLFFSLSLSVNRNNIETFKITHEYDRWHLHLHDRTVKTCNNLTELAKNIKTQSKQKLRLAPSEYGKHYQLKLSHTESPNSE